MCAARDKKPGFDSEFNGEILKIKLRGEIDHHSAVAIRIAVDDMIRDKRPFKLVIDMSSVELMDSSGLGLIMGRYAVMNEIGGQTVILDPSVRVKKIMVLAGMERIIKIEYSSGKSGDTVRQAHSAAVMSTARVNNSDIHGKGRKRKEETK